MKENAKTKKVQARLATPIGIILLAAEKSKLVSIQFGDNVTPSIESKKVEKGLGQKILQQATEQLEQYFKGERRIFDLPLLSMGTPFQQAVWQEIAKIPYGETRSYKEIAAALGDSNKARAVGQAANKNHLPIVIPCHRVVGSTGRLKGFAGGLEIQQYLLKIEAKLESDDPL